MDGTTVESQGIRPEINAVAVDPWENSPFGSLTSATPPKTGKPPEIILPVPIPPDPKPEPEPEPERKGLTIQEIRRRKEAITQAIFKITFNKERLSKVEIPKRNFTSLFATEDEDTEARDELIELRDRMMRLPEHLQFEPGITLIVGENGAGKSTLARALFMAVQYHEAVEMFGDPETAHKVIFEPLGSDLEAMSKNTNDVELAQAGLSPEIAQSMKIDEVANGINSQLFHYYDAPVMIGHQRPRDYISEAGNYRSHRQTVDWAIFDELKREMGRPTGKGGKWHTPHRSNPGLYFIDEPDTGMDPRRHRKIEEEIMDCTVPGSIVILPTNSVVLDGSDLPRIDLNYPERGIHRPSEYTSEQPVKTS